MYLFAFAAQQLRAIRLVVGTDAPGEFIMSKGTKALC